MFCIEEFSVNAFKRKIKDWNLRRSYTAAEKDLFCQHITDGPHQYCEICSALMRRRPISQSDIRRHKAARRRELAHLAVVVTRPTTVSMTLGEDSQRALRATQDLWLYQVGSALANSWETGWCDMSLVSDLTDVAIYLSLPDGKSLAESTMRHFCYSLNNIIEYQPMGVLLAAFELIINPRWLHHPRTQANLHRFISKKIVSCKRINPFLYRIFDTIKSLEALRLIMPQMLSLQAQTLLNNFTTHTDNLLGLLTDNVIDLVHCQKFAEALELACSIPQTTQLCHMKQCEAQLLISRCQFEVGAHREAILNGNMVLQDCDAFVAVHDKSYAYTYINTCDVLARCCDALADLQNVVAYRTRAYTTALEIFGTQASNTVYHQAYLKSSTERLEQLQRPLPAAPAYALGPVG